MTGLLTESQLEDRLREIGRERYHDRHPFHHLMIAGQLTRGQLQAWALNRYYYQAMVPIKDATILAKIDDPAVRRAWRERLVDQDGDREEEGGIARWLILTDGLGLDRGYVQSCAGLLPATRFAVDAYVNFCRERSLLEAVASSLTELFSPTTIEERVRGLLTSYDFITPKILRYFQRRGPQAASDTDFALSYVKREARTPEKQQKVCDALAFKCGVLWSQLDALHFAYVAPAMPPPGAFAPDG